MTAADNDTARVIEALQRHRASSGGRGRRSPLYRWLRQRQAQLRAILNAEDGSAPGWGVVAEALAREGVVDGSGKAPSAERVRKVWWAVRRDLKAAAAGKAKQPPVVATPSRYPVAAAPEPVQSLETAAEHMRRLNATMVARGHQVPKPVMPSATEVPEISQRAVDERIAEIKAQMAAMGHQMPRKVEP